MELTLNISYEQVANLIKQLPANQIAKITKEFSESYITEKAKTEISDFQKFILSGPVMSDEQYSDFKQQRQHYNLPLATLNKKHFERIKGLQIIT